MSGSVIRKINHLLLIETLFSHSNSWIDGFSVFHVNQKGLINKHTVEKMMPDEEKKVCSKVIGGVAAFLALGLVNRPAEEGTEADTSLLDDLLSILT